MLKRESPWRGADEHDPEVSTLYSYQQGEFVETGLDKAAPSLQSWSYFDWEEDPDFDNQIDRRTDVARKKFLPKGGRVKKNIYLPADRTAHKFVVLICYTVPNPPERYSRTEDIFLAAFQGEDIDLPVGFRRSYKKLWTEKLSAYSDYGDLMVENVPGAGQVLALYSESHGVDSATYQLDVFLLHDFPER